MSLFIPCFSPFGGKQRHRSGTFPRPGYKMPHKKWVQTHTLGLGRSDFRMDWNIFYKRGKHTVMKSLLFPFLKNCCLVLMVEFLSLRDSLNQYFWVYPLLFLSCGFILQDLTTLATCVFFSHSLGTTSTVLRMGFELHLKNEWKVVFIYSAITSLILRLCGTPANKEAQDCY